MNSTVQCGEESNKNVVLLKRKRNGRHTLTTENYRFTEVSLYNTSINSAQA